MPNFDDPHIGFDEPAVVFDFAGIPPTVMPGDLSSSLLTTLLLDSPLDSSFFSGQGTVAQAQNVSGVALAGHVYVIDPEQYQHNTIPPLKVGQDSSQEPGSQSYQTEGAWPRSIENFILGAGQYYQDDHVTFLGDGTPASNRAQYRLSQGIDPWTRRQIGLLPDTTQIRTCSSATPRLLATPDHLYLSDSATLVHTPDPTGDSPVFTSVVLGGVDVLDMTVAGGTVYLACGANGIKQTVVGSTSVSSFCPYQAQLCRFVNGTLIAAQAGQLAQIAADATSSVLFDHWDPAFAWTAIVEAPSAIYAAGNSGDHAGLFQMQYDKSTGLLLPPVSAGMLPYGEQILSMVSYQGFMLLGTSKGFRLSSIDSSGGIQYGPLIKIPGGVTALEPQEQFAWFAWANYTGVATGLGRADLSHFTDASTLIPAYASDLMADDQGPITSICTYGDRRYFTVGSSAMYGESDSLVASGSLFTGNFRWETIEPKLVSSVELHHAPLPAGASVSAALVEDSGNLIICGTSSKEGSLGPSGPLPTQDASGEAIEARLTLSRGKDVTTGPILHRVTLRATVTPPRTDEIIVPLLLHEAVDTPSGRQLAMDPLAEYQFLKGLENTQEVVTYQEGDAAYQVQINRVMQQPFPGRKWTSDSSYFNGTLFVRLLTVGTTV